MKKTLVLGASLKPQRYSNIAINRLVMYNQPVVAIGLKEGEVAGVVIHKDRPHFDNVHTVTLYINPSRQPEYYSYILSLQPKRIIFNPGTENTEFYELLNENNINYEVACTLVLLGTNQY